MKKLLLLIPLLFLCAGLTPVEVPPSRFLAVDVYLNTSSPLAAYQLDLTTLSGAQIVGLEGGAHPAFSSAPFYDPAALANSAAKTNRIILAAYSLKPPADLPTGNTRVARLHLLLQSAAAPEISQKLIVATNASGDSIPATITLRTSEGEPK